MADTVVSTSGTATVIVVPPPVATTSVEVTSGGRGPKGDRGDPFAFSYVHEQPTPAAVWTVVHGLEYVPSITVTDSAGSVVVGAVTYVDPATIRVTFSSAFAGRAYCS